MVLVTVACARLAGTVVRFFWDFDVEVGQVRVRRMAVVAVMAVVTIALQVAAGLQGPPALAAPEPAHTMTAPAPCLSDTPRVRYVVLFAAGSGADAARAEILRACGSLVGYYPEIAVAVATSADSSFADRIGRDRAYSAQAEALTGAERPDQEPRPGGSQSSWTAVAAAGGTDRTAEQWDMTIDRKSVV
jgi:hypothetical protein